VAPYPEGGERLARTENSTQNAGGGMARRLIVGCGYLGKVLAARWRDAGHAVVATTRSADRAAEWRRSLQDNGWEPVVCDVLDPASLAALPPVDAAVYAVGFDRSAGLPMRRVYVEGLAAVAAALTAPRIVYVSSTSVYGQTDGSVVDETSPTGPLEESGKVVLEAEATLRAARPDAILARSAGLYGPGRLLRAEALRKGEPIVGLPDKWLNLVHVADAAAAIDRLLEAAPAGGVFTVADGSPVRRRDFYATLARLLGAPEPRWLPPPEPLPASERVDRRVAAPGLRALGWRPAYADYAAGLSQAVGSP